MASGMVDVGGGRFGQRPGCYGIDGDRCTPSRNAAEVISTKSFDFQI
jgi:hypothetical protein